MALHDCGHVFKTREDWAKWLEMGAERYGAELFMELREKWNAEEQKERLRNPDEELRERYGDAFDNLTQGGK